MTERWKQEDKPVITKTPEQWAAEAEGNDPWACPRCGCKDWRVLDKRDAATGNIRRTRVCRHCGNGRIYTTEIPDSNNTDKSA